MKSNTKRLWQAILVFATSLAILGWLLEPRPSEVIRIPPDQQLYGEQFQLSPDEKHLIVIHSEVHLVDLEQRRELLSIPYTNDQFGFDSQGRFVWLELKKTIFGLDNGLLLTLWRYDPLTCQTVKLLNRQLLIVDENGPDTWFKGLHQLGLYREHALLSPDYKTLLMPRYTYFSASFELVDIDSGKVKAPLQIAPISLRECSTLLLETEFSGDGQTLLVQTEERTGGDIHYRLRLFSTTTGKELNSLRLPGTESLGSGSSSSEGRYYHGFERTSEIYHNPTRLGRILCLDATHVVGVWNHEWGRRPKGIMLIDFAKESVTKTAFDEHQLSPADEVRHGKSEDKQVFPEIEILTSNSKDELLSVASYQESSQLVGRLEGDRYLPVLSFSRRSVKDGQQVGVCRYAGPEKASEYSLEPGVFLTLLPDGRAVYKQSIDMIPKLPKFREWINKVRDWLRLPYLRGLYVINTQTGVCECVTHTTSEIYSAHSMSHGKYLAVTGNDDDGLFLLKYDYPLHKPWGLIFSWALALSAIPLALGGIKKILDRRHSTNLRHQEKITTNE